MRKRFLNHFSKKDILFGALVFIVVVLGYLGAPYITIDSIRNAVLSLGNYGPIFIILAQILTAIFAPLPNSAVTIVAGTVYGTTLGGTLSIIGGLLGAILTYELSKRLGRGFIKKLLTKKEMTVIDRFFHHHGFKTIFLMRFLPTISFDAVSYGAGLTKMKRIPFILATLLGMIPSTFIYAYVGEQVKSTQAIVLIIILLAVAGLPFASNVFREKKPLLVEKERKFRQRFRERYRLKARRKSRQ